MLINGAVDDNGLCSLLFALPFGSKYKGSTVDEEMVREIIDDVKNSKLVVPERFNKLVNELLGAFLDKNKKEIEEFKKI